MDAARKINCGSPIAAFAAAEIENRSKCVDFKYYK
jgi:hypothetical protein